MQRCRNHSSLEWGLLFGHVLQQDEGVGGHVILAGSERRERERHEVVRGIVNATWQAASIANGFQRRVDPHTEQLVWVVLKLPQDG